MTEKLYTRKCPSCGKEIFHARLKDRNVAEKKQILCKECSNENRKLFPKEKQFSRNCPICDALVWHVTEKQCKKSADKPCQSCTKKLLWEQADSPLRNEETRLKRNASISIARQDPDSGYNTEEREQKQSQSMIKAWENSEILNSEEYRKNQSELLKAVWLTDEYRSKRLSEETLKSFSEKMSKAWSEKYFEFTAALKMAWNDPIRRENTKNRLDQNLLNPEFRARWYNAKTIKVSKIELRIKDQLKKLGFIHSSEHNAYIIRFIPDFINFDTKEIIEIYGDYWHCNPNISKYCKPNKIHSKLKMTTEEKWERDFIRVKLLEEQGYKVIILWENDIKLNNYDISKFLRQI